jgi:hypothetical protein
VITITSSIGAYPTMFIHIFIFCYRVMFIHWPSMDFHLVGSHSSIKVHSINSTTFVLIPLIILLIQFENMIGANIKKFFSHYGSFGFYNFFGHLCAIIYLGSMLLHTTNDNQLMKKISWFCETWVPFKWKYWMALDAPWIELNSWT